MVENIRVEENLPRTGQLPLSRSLVSIKRKASEISRKLRSMDKSSLAEKIDKTAKSLANSRDVLRPGCTHRREELFEKVSKRYFELVGLLETANTEILNSQEAPPPSM